MAYQVKENFGNYLDVVGVTNHHSLELYDFSNVDYILTTVPIDIPVPIPIIRTSTFFETSFIHQVNQAITDTRSSRFIEYFHKNMVFGSSSDDKNEILEHMCENAVQNYDIPDDFFHYVMKCEEIGRTSFGNLITIAHPIHPIDWDGNGEMVKHIFMIGVPKESGSNLHMRIISELSKNIMRNAWRESFMYAASADEALEILKLIEKEVI